MAQLIWHLFFTVTFECKVSILLSIEFQLINTDIHSHFYIKCSKNKIKKRERKVPLVSMKVKVKSFSHVQLCDPMDCSLPSSFIHGIFHVRVLEWAASTSLGGLPIPGIKLRSPALQTDALPSEPPGKL